LKKTLNTPSDKSKSRGVGKLEVKVKTNPSTKTNPPQKNNTANPPNPQNQLDQDVITTLQQLLEKVINARQQMQQLLQANSQPQQPQINNLNPQINPQLNNNKSNTLSTIQNNDQEFIVKSQMKASVVALRIEQMLLLNKRITLSGLGYAIPVLLDSIMLIRKDYAKLNKNLIIENIELFERQFTQKTVSGLRITLKLQ